MTAYDLVVRNGEIHDGTGAEPLHGDVAIKDGRIVAVGKVSGAGREEIDGEGKLVTPGFVDIHTHYDGQATWDAQLAPSSVHGVTTAIGGNCGFSIAPTRREDRRYVQALFAAVSETLLEASARRGLRPGILAVLHTWTRGSLSTHTCTASSPAADSAPEASFTASATCSPSRSSGRSSRASCSPSSRSYCATRRSTSVVTPDTNSCATPHAVSGTSTSADPLRVRNRSSATSPATHAESLSPIAAWSVTTAAPSSSAGVIAPTTTTEALRPRRADLL